MQKSENIQVDRSFTRVKYQFLAVIVGNILTFSQGCNIGWYSPALPVINSVPSPLIDGPISNDMAGWIGSFLALGAIFGGLSFGFLANWIGYKRSMLLSFIPIFSSWMFIIFGKYAWQICVSRFLSGVAGGSAFTCFPQFVAQFSSDHVRGQLNSFIQIACYLGIFIGFIGGSYLPYHINPIIMSVLPVIFLVLFWFFPESPQYLLHLNRVQDAEKSLRFYRNIRVTDTANNETLLLEFEKLQAIAKQNELSPSLTVADFVTPKALKAMMICPFLMAVNQFSGAFAISNYAETIFKDTGSTIDPKLSAIVMAGMQVIGTYTASQLMDKVGRKVLLLVSLASSIFALSVTGAYSYLSKHDYDVTDFNWVPMVSISVFIFSTSIGILPAPYVMLSEVIPQKIRRIGTTICTCAVFICQSIMLRLMPVLLFWFELYGAMWLFACVSMIGLLFTIFVVKETKGQNLDVLDKK